MSDSTPVRTRMAPSPTGEYHIGHLRTLLYNYALAKQNNGQFVIRIEDTDQKRFVPGAQEKILQVIRDYGLIWDEGPDIGGPYAPYIQTQRLPIYQEYIEKLIGLGGAYYCFCSSDRLDQMRQLQKASGKLPKYDRHCLNLSQAEIKANLQNKVPYVVRLKMPEHEVIEFDDLVRGKIRFNTADVDDQILVKSNGIPTYHFAAGIDDHLMQITHVLRGDEWISSVPKQFIIYRYFGWVLPQFAHLPVLLDPSGHGKMSKRRGSVSARSFLDEGYLPEAVLNFLMLLGWNPGTDQEFFSLADFIKVFSVKHLHKKQPVFDRVKLDYINGLYIRQKSNEDLAKLLKPFIPQAADSDLLFLAPLLKERLTKLSDATAVTKFLFEDITIDKDTLLQNKFDPQLVEDMLTGAVDILQSYPDFSSTTEIQTKLIDMIKAKGFKTGEFFMVFRVALSGQKITPPIIECLPLLGRPTTLDRLQQALDLLQLN